MFVWRPSGRPQLKRTPLGGSHLLNSKCYLCGESIEGRPSQDHVPPRQFFAPQIRAAVNTSRLITLPAHQPCNQSYSSDEEYFVWSPAPLAAGSTSADVLNAYNASKFKAGRNVKLGLKTLREFDHRPGGLYLPAGLVAKKVEGTRIKRVAWKIVRGLHYHETNAVLPENTVFTMDVFGPHHIYDSDLDELWDVVKAQPSRGIYGGVFDYKRFVAAADGVELHGWGMLLWDKIMIFIGVDPARKRAAA